jgi:hypothetical protein
MSLDPAGEWGLRYRIRLASKSGWTDAAIAAALGVSEFTIHQYLNEPTFVPDPTDTAAMLSNLANLVPLDAFVHHTDTPGGVRIWYYEAPLWTDALLDGVVAPERAERFKVNYLADSEQHRVRSSRVYYLDEMDPAEVARDATGDDLTRLVSIVFYGPR